MGSRFRENCELCIERKGVMYLSKLNLDQKLIHSSRNAAKVIADDVQKFIDEHTTTSTERTIARLLGVDGVDEIDKPLPNVLIDNIKEGGGLERGIAYWLGNAVVQTGDQPQEIAEKIARENWTLLDYPQLMRKKFKEPYLKWQRKG